VTESRERDAQIPFGQDFTPSTLGKKLDDESRVLPWLLRTATSAENRRELANKIGTECLSHVPNDKDRRDMASHVVNAMKAYHLIKIDTEAIAITPVGELLRDAGDDERDVLFARRIITMCKGQQFLDAIKRYELRGETPNMEDLSIELGEHGTSKNISTLRAWLARAGVVTAIGTSYRVIDEGLDRVLGQGVASLYGLNRLELEFLLAARIIQQQQGGGALDAVEVADLAEARGEDVRIRRKSLDRFVKDLAQQGHVRLIAALTGKGGSRTAFELLEKSVHVSEEQLRELLAQSEAGFALSELLPLDKVVAELGHGTAEKIGRFGEQLAVHLCLMLGLRVRSWRKRAPHSEIDLIAERLASLAYQRWVVQVKNTDGNLDADQVDREVGATTGLGVSHILFVVPRAAVTQPALNEIRVKSRLTHLHIYILTTSMLAEKKAEPILRHLRRQARQFEAEKRAESEARERG